MLQVLGRSVQGIGCARRVAGVTRTRTRATTATKAMAESGALGSATGGSTLDNNDEIFDIFDENNKLIGQARREDVHKQGLFHRAVNVVLMDNAGRVLLQQRSVGKAINGGCWDVSVGEHLSPGETYRQAAVRGLAEELGLAGGDPGDALVCIEEPRLCAYSYPEVGKIDNEFCALYLWRGFDPAVHPVVPDGIEVCDVAWLPLDHAAGHPDLLAHTGGKHTPTLNDSLPLVDPPASVV